MSDVPNRLLRETLRDRLEPSSECLDADVLAAWADGMLSRGDRLKVESHAASCARCQAMVAAMARTAAPLPARKWWQASAVRWLVPLATVSTLAVVVWMNVPVERPAVPAARFDAAESRSADVTLPAEKPTPAPKPGPNREDQRVAKPAAPSAAPAAATAAQLEAASSAAVAPQAQGKTTRDEVQRNVAAPPAPAAAPPAPTAPPPARVAPIVAPRATAEMTKTLPAQSAADIQSSPPLEIPSPDRSVRWRIVAGNTVERSTDGGATWETQSNQGAGWTAGAAPSPTICWLVGKRGAVLLSKDGLLWQRVAFPEPIDLAAIAAIDGSNATVTAADGRVFTTTDGGKTWRLQ